MGTMNIQNDPGRALSAVLHRITIMDRKTWTPGGGKKEIEEHDGQQKTQWT